jgi:hypothetical protein
MVKSNYNSNDPENPGIPGIPGTLGTHVPDYAQLLNAAHNAPDEQVQEIARAILRFGVLMLNTCTTPENLQKRETYGHWRDVPLPNLLDLFENNYDELVHLLYQETMYEAGMRRRAANIGNLLWMVLDNRGVLYPPPVRIIEQAPQPAPPPSNGPVTSTND